MGKSVCPALVCSCFAVTLSAHHCTSLIHCTVCPVSTDLLALSALVCPSLGSGHFSDTGLLLGVATAISFYTDHLRSFPAVCTVLTFVRAIWGWQSPAATHSLTPSGIEKFWIQGLQFSAPGPGLKVSGSSFSAFWQGNFSVFGPQSRSILPIKTHFGWQKLNPLFCGVWSSALIFGSKTMNGHPNQRFWGNLSWVGGDIRKTPLHSQKDVLD